MTAIPRRIGQDDVGARAWEVDSWRWQVSTYAHSRHDLGTNVHVSPRLPVGVEETGDAVVAEVVK